MSTNQPSTSAYKTLGTIRNGVKIWKFQNKMSAIDVTHILNSYREKIKGESKELIYAGRLCFSVTSGGNHGKAYLDKKEAKMLFAMIQNGTFSKNYPSAAGGYKNYGGSVKEGKVLANILKINVFAKEMEDYRTKEKKTVHKVEISIQELPGQKTETGGYKAIGKATKEVKTILDPKDLLSMAIECTDFIHAAEVKGMAEGIPLNTITNYEYEKLPLQRKNQKNIEEEEVTVQQVSPFKTEEELQPMEGKKFYEEYLKMEREMKKYQKEYDRRVALKNKAETVATT